MSAIDGRPMRFAVGDKVWHRPTRAAGIIVDVKPEVDQVILEQGVNWLSCDDCELMQSGGNVPAVKHNPAAEAHPTLGDTAVLDPKLRAEQLRADAAKDGYLPGDEVEVNGRVETVTEVDDVQHTVQLRGDREGVRRSWDELTLRKRPKVDDRKDLPPEVDNLVGAKTKGKVLK